MKNLYQSDFQQKLFQRVYYKVDTDYSISKYIVYLWFFIHVYYLISFFLFKIYILKIIIRSSIFINNIIILSYNHIYVILVIIHGSQYLIDHKKLIYLFYFYFSTFENYNIRPVT